MTVVIPEELLAPLRDGLFFDLYVQVEEASALIDPRKRGNIGGEVRACLARANRTRALLDVVGWVEPVEVPTAVEVDARKHREALLRTLLARIESEHGIEEDPEASDEARAAAKARIGQLTDLIVGVEEAGS
ncbi:MAG TPA: hypothetical protein VG147_04745 [Solirubrobacteraceae bacterium]|jgi:hypothetical protein|nr:hypothetical protein [Solirubrobacteraceae bacterium]